MRSILPWVCALFGAAWLPFPARCAPAPLPEPGGLTALPETSTAAVPLANPGFEEQEAGWLGMSAGGAFSVAAGQGAHSGNACLRLDCAQATPWVPGVRQALQETRPGAYVLRGWVKLRDVGGPANSLNGMRLGLDCALQSGQAVRETTTVLRGTRDWQPVELHLLVPTEIKPGTLAVNVHRYGGAAGGEALIDDLSLERVLPPPVEAYLLYPNYRGYLPDEGPQRVRLWVRVDNANAREPVRVEVRGADDAGAVAAAEVPAGTKEQVVEFDAGKWAPGRYLIQASLGAYRYPAYLLNKIAAADRTRFPVWFDPQQVVHLAGKPTFPLGLYNTLTKFGTVDTVDIDRLQKMAEAPVNFNINYWSWGCDLATRRRYLAEMQKRGIRFLDTANNLDAQPGQAWDFPIYNELMPEANKKLASPEEADRFLSRLGEAMRDVPGFAGWYTMDERSFQLVPSRFRQYQALRRAAPSQPAFGISTQPTELACWRDTLDVIGMDPYPLMNMRAGRPLSLVGEWTRTAVEATHASRPVWMVLQFFQGWSTDRWPTEEELRTMSLMSIAEGARGIFYWSFGNRALASVGEAKREEYWQRLVKVMRELRSLEPALIAPDAPQVVKSVSDERVRWRARVAGGKTYLFAYLPAERFVADPAAVPTTEVRFTLADGRQARLALRPDFAAWVAVGR